MGKERVDNGEERGKNGSWMLRGRKEEGKKGRKVHE